jgi:hypothetical protein
LLNTRESAAALPTGCLSDRWRFDVNVLFLGGGQFDAKLTMGEWCNVR